MAARSTSPSRAPGGGGPPVDPAHTVARLSSPWSTDDTFSSCSGCSSRFHQLNRRHHCRLCGRIFCGECTSHRSLVPPSSIVLVPKGGGGWRGKKVDSRAKEERRTRATFSEEEDPDREITYLRSPSERAEGGGGSAAGDAVLYGRGLEERAKLAREPLRVCDACHEQLRGVQEQLRLSNANAMRYNAVDPTDVRRLFNSPLAFTLGHEVRKAAYTLNNLLPLPKRMGAFVSSAPDYDPTLSGAYAITNPTHAAAVENCKDTCTAVGANLGDLDGVRIPARLLEKAKGVAVLTVVKGGLGFAGFEFGTGLVVARLPDGRGWSPPSAVGCAGVSWGALVGAQVSDHVFLLMTDRAVELMGADDASFTLGADVGVAVGPLGRSVEADLSAAGNAGGEGGGVSVAPIYTYSLSKGLYAGVSLDGKVMVSRHRVNEKFYGYRVKARDLLNGEVPTPPAAQPLYDALKRCHVYATTQAAGGGGAVLERCIGIGGGGGGGGGLGESTPLTAFPPGGFGPPGRMDELGFGGSFSALAPQGGGAADPTPGAATEPAAEPAAQTPPSAPPEETRPGVH